MKSILIITLLILSPSLLARSFNEVQKETFDRPNEKLPQIQGITPNAVIKALALHLGEIVDRSNATFASHDDFRVARPKLLHPRGVCAEAVWEITENSPATGLFSKGTKVPAIIRFSSGTAESEHLPEDPNYPGRIFGLAVKVFPTTDLDENVVTKNIQMLDTYGFDRSTRARFFHHDDLTPVTFTNVAPAKSLLGKTLATFFDRFDKPNFVRPVYPLSEVDLEGEVQEARSPYELILKANFTATSRPQKDFRHDILKHPLNKREMSMDIIIKSLEPKNLSGRLVTVDKRIGRLIIGRKVVSEGCDLTLHFNHPHNRK